MNSVDYPRSCLDNKVHIKNWVILNTNLESVLQRMMEIYSWYMGKLGIRDGSPDNLVVKAHLGIINPTQN